MKNAIIPLIVVTGAIGLTYYFIGTKNKEAPFVEKHRFPAATSVNSDPTEVFQRAFWKRPTAADKILHAERREWADVSGVKKWQWFIQVEPSAELLRYLRDENSFSLVTASSAPTLQDAPSWFTPPSSGTEILQAPRGSMCLIFSGGGDLLYAAAAGGGFQPGAQEPTNAPPAVPTPTGRLPTSPPPDPSRE